MNEDTNSIVRTYLLAQAALIAVATGGIFCSRLEENASLPAVSFFTRGGSSDPYIPGIVTPSIQFDCWGASPIAARQVYRLLFDALQGIQNETVSVGGSDYVILSAIEEVQGQDLVDEIQGYFRVMAFFSIMIRAE